MHKRYRYWGSLAALLLSASVYAGDIKVEGSWIRATAPGQDTAGVDLSITSKQPATLLGVSSTASGAVELHSMSQKNGVMKMRQEQTIKLPGSKRVNLGESGYHLMLVGLKAPLKVGDNIPLTLTIKLTDKRTVMVDILAEVRPLTATKSATQEDEQEHHHH